MHPTDLLATLATASRTLAQAPDDTRCIAEFCGVASAFGVATCAVYVARGVFSPPGTHPLDDAPPELAALIARASRGGDAVLAAGGTHFVVALGPASQAPAAFVAGSAAGLDDACWNALRVLATGLERIDRTARSPHGRDPLAALAHDVRGPLTSIIGFAELIREGVLDATEVADAAGTIVSAARRLSALATDTVTASLLERNLITLRRDPVDLGRLMREAIDECGDFSRVGYAPVENSVEVEGDPGRLRQALGHLIGNALKFSPRDATVAVEVRGSCDRVVALVRDDGIGIPAAELGAIFERGVRGANARTSSVPGRGLGLFVARGLVALHGGEVRAESAGEGCGATFVLSLPARVRGTLK